MVGLPVDAADHWLSADGRAAGAGCRARAEDEEEAARGRASEAHAGGCPFAHAAALSRVRFMGHDTEAKKLNEVIVAFSAIVVAERD